MAAGSTEDCSDSETAEPGAQVLALGMAGLDAAAWRTDVSR